MGMETALKIQGYMRTAAVRYGGICATVALAALGELFQVPIDETTLFMGLGLRFPGSGGAAQCAFSGAALFLAYTAHRCGAGREDILHMCAEWQGRFESYLLTEPCQLREEDECAAAVVLLAYGFMGEKRHALGLDGAVSKPKQYYDGIYADRESMFKHSPYALEEKLSKAVTKGEEAMAMAALREITAQGEKAVLAKDPLRSAKNSMIGSIAFLARAAIQAGVSTNDAFALSDALTQRVEEMGARAEVLAFEENILLQFIALVRQRLESAYSTPVVRVMHYVENHLDAKIALSGAADYAGVHPAYLSARFRREAGVPFANYVAMRKIQESCYFVQHTDYPISQIASLYGFSSQSYYITVFKRVMNTTPTEYRCRRLSE